MKTVEGFKLRQLGKEYIIVGENLAQVDFNKMISLNESAAFLWKVAAEGEFTVQNLADALVAEYGIEMERALADSEAICAKWKEAGIVED